MIKSYLVRVIMETVGPDLNDVAPSNGDVWNDLFPLSQFLRNYMPIFVDQLEYSKNNEY